MREEQIDNYVLGKMSTDEQISFEQQLVQDDSLKQEVDLHRDIVRAIRLKAAKEQMQQIENNIKAMKHRHKAFVIRFMEITIAACLAIGIFIHIDISSNYKEVGKSIILTLDSPRGNNTIDNIYQAIEQEQYETALRLIKEAESQKLEFQFANQELQKQAQIEYNNEHDDLRWWKTVVYMRTGKWIRARKLLKQIIVSDNYYKIQAQAAFDKLR